MGYGGEFGRTIGPAAAPTGQRIEMKTTIESK